MHVYRTHFCNEKQYPFSLFKNTLAWILNVLIVAGRRKDVWKMNNPPRAQRQYWDANRLIEMNRAIIWEGRSNSTISAYSIFRLLVRHRGKMLPCRPLPEGRTRALTAFQFNVNNKYGTKRENNDPVENAMSLRGKRVKCILSALL